MAISEPHPPSPTQSTEYARDKDDNFGRPLVHVRESSPIWGIL